MATYPIFKISHEFPTAASIMKFAGTSHGLTLTTFSVIDKQNADLQISIVCSGISQLNDYVEQLKGILQTNEVTKVYIRSVKVDDVFQESYLDLSLEKTNSAPTSHEQFKNKSHVICDIEITEDSQTWKFWRMAEENPRVINFTVATE